MTQETRACSHKLTLVGERCRLVYGTYRESISTHRRLPAAPARQCEHDQSATAQRPAVRGRARLQMARPARAFWQLAHDLHADEPLEQGGGAGPGLCPAAT